jgi:hypothetical protein
VTDIAAAGVRAHDIQDYQVRANDIPASGTCAPVIQAVDLDGGLLGLTGLLDHFVEEFRAVDDIALFESEFVLFEDGTHTGTPSAPRFEISSNRRLRHKNSSPSWQL